MKDEELYKKEFYKLGVFYVNSENSKLFVPKRHGLGWTINFGRWSAWMFVAFIICALVALSFILKSN